MMFAMGRIKRAVVSGKRRVTRMDIEYLIAYAASHGYCAATVVPSLRELEKELWPQMQGPLYVRREVFRSAARDVLQELNESEKCRVLDNEECASLLALAGG